MNLVPEIILLQLRDARWQVDSRGRRVLVGSAAEATRWFDQHTLRSMWSRDCQVSQLRS